MACLITVLSSFSGNVKTGESNIYRFLASFACSRERLPFPPSAHARPLGPWLVFTPQCGCGPLRTGVLRWGAPRPHALRGRLAGAHQGVKHGS